MAKICRINPKFKNKNKSNIYFKIYSKTSQKALNVFVSEFVKYSFSDNLNKFVIVPVIPAMLKDYQLKQIL
ncbi:hypothetical protein MASR2M54_23570 [Aliarcobacter cryaerophilus]